MALNAIKQPRSVYVHVPFCRHRCGYCNFTLIADRDDLVEQYLQAIEIEMSQVEGRPQVDTIYLGGGTPSRLSARSLDYLLKLLDQRFELTAGGEFTIEANPDDLPGEIDSVIRDSKINRISLGVQSFDKEKLRSLDRDHDMSEIESALEATRTIADRFSIDLMFAAPHDSLDLWRSDLERATNCGATHVSTYELTYEKGTQFWNRMNAGDLKQTDQETSADFYEATISQLQAAGFQQYEISSFARDGHCSRHNQVYWSGNPYLAFGPGASGFLSNVRYTNHRSVTRYLSAVLEGETAIKENQKLSARELAAEQIVFGLRMIDGVDLHHFRSNTEMELTDLVPEPVLLDLVNMELIEYSDSRLKMTKAGLFVGDLVCSTILNSVEV